MITSDGLHSDFRHMLRLQVHSEFDFILLLLVSSTDGLILIPTDTSWLRNSSFIVARPVNTSAF
ncbi:hypothetical protein Tco_0314646, partial [Tanacetum coccineum]